MKVTQFKNYYESVVLEAQQLQDTVSMLNNVRIMQSKSCRYGDEDINCKEP